MKEEKKLLVANWKMNPQSKKEAEIIFSKINEIKNLKHTEVVICPPFPFLFLKKKNSKIKLGSQDVFYEKEGSFTGEVSIGMLKDFGVEYVIVGHSERRSMGETDELINKKISTLLKAKITPIFCIGERDRDNNGSYLSFIKHQIEEGLKGIIKSQIKNIVIAYEPIWAIGKDAKREATPSEFTEVRIFIKKIISDLYDTKTANEVRIIYGGSVNPLNAESFIKEGGALGLLVGRDSLNPKKWSEIINVAGK